MSPEALEDGYWRAYREFYRWTSIARGAAAHADLAGALRHAAYAAGWKKFEPLWDLVIRARRTAIMLPVLESILSECGRRDAGRPPAPYSTRGRAPLGTRPLESLGANAADAGYGSASVV
jgi:hypothetical protein